MGVLKIGKYKFSAVLKCVLKKSTSPVKLTELQCTTQDWDDTTDTTDMEQHVLVLKLTGT